MDLDLQVRTAAFNWLQEQVEIHGDVLPRTLLEDGFQFQGQRIPLVSPQGIFKPQILDLPLSITTSPKSPYDDSFTEDGYLRYRYRGTDVSHPDNVGLRKVFAKQRPLVYFHGILPGRYLAIWPVFIVADDPNNLAFRVAVEDLASLEVAAEPTLAIAEEADARQAYRTTAIRLRLHQRSFREKVLDAYRSQCAFCRLRHRELLDAAHIIPDRLPESRSSVNHGVALCKLHHAAYDSFILGVSPDYVIQVRADVLEEADGPVLQHGLKELHGIRLILPARRSDWPSRDALEWKFQRFRKAA